MTDTDLTRLWQQHYTTFGGCDLPLLRAVAQAARDELIATIEAKRAEWVRDATVAGDRRDWDGTNTYEAMADAAQRLVAAIRSRAAKGGEK